MLGQVHGFPSLEEFFTMYGWELVDKKRRVWFHGTRGKFPEEQAIEQVYVQIADLESIGIKLTENGYERI